jgi:hypothetical protein
MAVFGGSNGAGFPAEDYQVYYNSGGWTWMDEGFFPGVPRVLHTAIWTGSVMVVWGGYDGSSTYLGDGARRYGAVP